VLGLGALQIMLDKGQEDDWLSSHFILTLAIITAVSLITLVIYEWFHKEPVLEVRLFSNLSYTAANFMMFMVGAILFSSIVILPQFLQAFLGYTATLAGFVLSPAGIVMLLTVPIAGVLTGKVAAKWLILFGWITLGLSLVYSAHMLTLGLDFNTAVVLRILQSLGLGFLFVPLNTVAYSGMPREKNNQIASTINMVRNIGSGVGTSMIATLIARRMQLHQTNLVAHTSNFDPQWTSLLHGMAQQYQSRGSSLVTGQQKALGSLYQGVMAQAGVMSYADAFFVLGVAAFALAVLTLFLPKNDPHESSSSTPVH